MCKENLPDNPGLVDLGSMLENSVLKFFGAIKIAEELLLILPVMINTLFFDFFFWPVRMTLIRLVNASYRLPER